MVGERAVIEVSYTLTPEDARKYYDDYQELHKKLPQPANRYTPTTIRYYLGLIAAPVALYVLLDLTFGDSNATNVVAGLGAIAWALAFRNIWKTLSRKRFNTAAGNSNFWTEHHLSGINADGFFDHSDRMMWTIFWAQVEEIYMQEHTIFFQAKRGETFSVIPIPRRAFASDADAQEFFRVAKALRAEVMTTSTTLNKHEVVNV